jgi:tetratricopeptide (TPR) repeat protein
LLERLCSKPALPLLAVLALVALAYQGSLAAPFISDDHALIEENPRLRESRSLTSFFAEPFWSRPDGQRTDSYYRPLVALTYAADDRLWSGEPFGFHLGNLLAHLACCALLYGLCLRAGGSPLAAALATALFGLFPRSTEAVTWVSGRADLLATLFTLTALALHRSERECVGRRLAAAATLEGSRRAAAQLAPLLTVVAGYGVLRVLFAEIGGVYDPFGPALRLLFAFQALGSYAFMLLDPLRPVASIGQLGLVEALPVLTGAALLAGLCGTGAAVVTHRAPPLIAAAFCLALAPLALVAHLVPIPLPTVAADRFLYLPVAGLALAAAWASSRLPPRWLQPATLATAGLIVAFGVATHLRNLDWQDEIRFWRHTLRHGPQESPQPHKELGTLYAWRGDRVLALTHYRRAIELERALAHRFPGKRVDPLLRANTALVLSELGKYENAARMLEQLVREDPSRPAVRLNLAAVYARGLEFDASAHQLDVALRLYPEYRLARTIRSQVERAKQIWAALPPEKPAEPIEARAARAEVFELVGSLADADRRWGEVADSPAASTGQVLRAARYLVHRGRDPDAAARAIARLQGLDAAAASVGKLERALANRTAHGSL